MPERPKLPFDSRVRDEPDSDRPRPPKQRAAFVTHDEMAAYVNNAIAQVLGPVRRIETMAKELRTESLEAKKERELRAKWDAEQRDRESIDLVRAKIKSESDLTQALQRPTTPLQFVPVAVPPAPDSEPDSPRKSRYNRTHVIGAIIAAITAISVAAIGAWNSQRVAPHGVPAAVEEHR